MPVDKFRCEPNQNLLVIYDSLNNVVWEDCVPIGTLASPVQLIIADTTLSEQNVPVHRDNYLVNGSDEYDIILPAGHYVAELYIPRTEHQALAGRQSVIAEPFTIEKVPVIDYELITEKRNGTWKHVLLFNIKGNIIPGMRFDDGTHQFEITEQDFEVEYNYSGTINITFTIDEIVINSSFSFQQIPIRLTIDLPILQAKLADRIVNNERELIWNIIYHEDELVLDTRGSVGDNVLIEINGGAPTPYDFGIFKETLPCVNGVHILNSLRVTAVLDFPGDNVEGIEAPANLTWTRMQAGGQIMLRWHSIDTAISYEVMSQYNSQPWSNASGTLTNSSFSMYLGSAWNGRSISFRIRAVFDNNVYSDWAVIALSENFDFNNAALFNNESQWVAGNNPPVIRYEIVHTEDTLEAFDLTSHNKCGLDRDESIIYELKIRKEELTENNKVVYKQGYTEYLEPAFKGGEQKFPPATPYTSKVWDTRFPFNRIRPCWVRDDGFVERYFKPDDLTKVEEIPVEVQQMEELQNEINKLKGELSLAVSNEEKTLIRNVINRTQNKLTEIAEEYTPQAVTYINDPKDYLKRTDGNVMIEFPNVWHNSFDEGDWIIVQMCQKQPEPARHWFATNVRNGVVHDTIYIGAFYSEPFDRLIDSEYYKHYNSNKYKDKYFESNEEESTDPKTQRYLDGIQGLGYNYDAFSFQNLVVLRLLQIFRFCSTDDFLITAVNTNTVQRNHNNFHPYDIAKKFAGLDYPFGFGIETRQNEPSVVRMPAVFNGHYETSGRETALFVSDKLAQVYDLYPFSHFVRRDRNIDRVTLFELTNDEPVPRNFGRIREYLSNAGWTKPSDDLLMTESSATSGSTMPLFVTPRPKTVTTFEASFGHLSTQLPHSTFVEESEKDKTVPQQFIEHQDYDLLHRAVWWKPNETYNLSVQYKEIMFVAKDKTARYEIIADSTGWKQVIEISGTKFEQCRVNRPFADGNALRAVVAVNLKIGTHPVRIALYDTNDMLVDEIAFNVSIRELSLPVIDKELWI